MRKVWTDHATHLCVGRGREELCDLVAHATVAVCAGLVLCTGSDRVFVWQGRMNADSREHMYRMDPRLCLNHRPRVLTFRHGIVLCALVRRVVLTTCCSYNSGCMRWPYCVVCVFLLLWHACKHTPHGIISDS
jgi:hypothetical protein